MQSRRTPRLLRIGTANSPQDHGAFSRIIQRAYQRFRASPLPRAYEIRCLGFAGWNRRAPGELGELPVGIIKAIYLLIRAFLVHRLNLAAENLALRQQVAVYKQTLQRPRLRLRDRVFWVWLSRLWSNWRSALAIVQPETVVKWRRKGFKLSWRWKSRSGKPGRPPIQRELRELIRRMSRENPLWGAPRILSELLLFGHKVAEGTVAKYMVRPTRPPSQTWRTFLANHAADIAACDFFTVPTATFRVLYVFIVLRHDRRQVVHFNVTAHPYAQWAAQQIIDAFPYDEHPRFLLRDRDGIYGDYLQQRVKSMGIEEILITPRAPWQNAFCERIVGSIRRGCLDHVIVLHAAHLKRILAEYFQYYHAARLHLSLDRNSPKPRRVEGSSEGPAASRRAAPAAHADCRITAESHSRPTLPATHAVCAVARKQ